MPFELAVDFVVGVAAAPPDELDVVVVAGAGAAVDGVDELEELEEFEPHAASASATITNRAAPNPLIDLLFVAVIVSSFACRRWKSVYLALTPPTGHSFPRYRPTPGGEGIRASGVSYGTDRIRRGSLLTRRFPRRSTIRDRHGRH
jgi:hypothetical protein